MIKLTLALLMLLLPVTASAKNAPSTTLPPPHTGTVQQATFPGLTPNSSYAVKFIASHYEDDPFPYILNAAAVSDGSGTVSVSAPMDAVSYGYYLGGRTRPVYEVKVCVYPPSDAPGVSPIECTPDTYVGYYPESMWYYRG